MPPSAQYSTRTSTVLYRHYCCRYRTVAACLAPFPKIHKAPRLTTCPKTSRWALLRLPVFHCAGIISGPAAAFCVIPSHESMFLKRGFRRDGLCRKNYVAPWCRHLGPSAQGVAMHSWRAPVFHCAGIISGPAAAFCVIPSHEIMFLKRGFRRDGLCRKNYVAPWCRHLGPSA